MQNFTLCLSLNFYRTAVDLAAAVVFWLAVELSSSQDSPQIQRLHLLLGLSYRDRLEFTRHNKFVLFLNL